MGPVIADMTMSLDGFVADPEHRADRLFGWFFGGDTEVATPDPAVSFRTTEESADVLRDAMTSIGAVVGGRTYFDLAQGWGGRHPMGVPVFVLTHRPPPEDWVETDAVRFVGDGIESAIAQAQEVAGGKTVGIATPSTTRQAYDAGLLDGLSVNVAPVLLGEGIPWFGGIDADLEDPDVVVGKGVTHLRYRFKKEA